MSPLIETLLWCVLQVTLVGVLALMLCAALRRFSSQGNPLVPAAALAAVAILTLCAFVPWPNWWKFGPQPEPVLTQRTPSLPAIDTHAANHGTVTDERAGDDAPEEPRDERTAALDTVEPTEPRTAAAPTVQPLREQILSWLPLTVTVVLSAGIALGLLQLAGGLFSVRSHRLASKPIADSSLSELIDVLRAELSLTRPIELRESEKLATAATIGWRRPVVLLPADWRNWTEDQKRAVLAHELAHVASGDYLACVLAQFSLAIHFYHPLVHWLAARLRLEQELAADATAAELSGGKRSYLASLAELALHTSERPLGWPAHTFLPTQGTFLRRIEMLRDSKPVSPALRPGSALRWAAVSVLIVGAAIIAGLRGGPAVSPFDNEASAQAPAAGGNAEGGGIDLTHVTNDATMLLAVRPAEVLANEQIRKAFSGATEQGAPLLKLLALDNLEQLTFLAPPGVEVDDWNSDAVVILQFSKATAIEDVVKTGFLPADVKRLPGGADAPSRFMAYDVVNDKTIAFGEDDVLTKYVSSRRKGQPAIAAGEAWNKVAKGATVAAVDMQVVRDEMAKQGGPRGPMPPEMAALAPLWKDSEYVAAGLIVEGKNVHLRQVVTCADAKLAENVSDTLKAAVTLSRNSLRSIREREKNIPDFAQFFLNTADGLLKTVKVEQSDSLVIAQTSTELPDVASPAASSFLSAIGAARGSAQKAESSNNMKQIAIALHNWADVHSRDDRFGTRFPPPVIYGKDGKGKVPHSWRVEMLPYLEQIDLYNAYNFDEPWDSEANKRILAKMPAVFRHPMDKQDSTSAAYYVLTPDKLLETKTLPDGGIEQPVGGLPTAFATKTGVRFGEMTDGTSNIIAIVEAKRDIPWTKPEDIVFDPAKDPPALGGFFKDGYHVGLCDGSVRFFTPKVEPATLKLLITPQDGQPTPALP